MQSDPPGPAARIPVLVVRGSRVAGGGVAGAIFFLSVRDQVAEGTSWVSATLTAGLVASVFGGMTAYGTRRSGVFVHAVRTRVARLGRRGRLVSAALAAIAICYVLASAGAELAKLAISALPAAFVLLFGGWACLLLDRRLRGCRRRAVRILPDLLAAAAFGGAVVVLFDRDVLTTQPAAGAVFPVAAWLSVRIWRAMLASRRLTVRTGADIVFALLLGTDLVLAIVWAANLFHLAPAEVRTLRSVLAHLGGGAGLPWQFWLGCYLALAAATVLFMIGGTSEARWARLLRGIRSIDLSRRLLSGIHIGLMVTVLIALATPAALSASLPVKARYRIDLQRELNAAGAEAAYQQIRRHFAGTSPPPPRPAPLAAIVVKIHQISPPPAASRDATETELHLARYLGRLQADVVASASVPTPPQRAGGGTSTPDAGDLRDRLDRLAGQQRRAASRSALANKAGELAAVVVAGALQIPNIGQHEIIQIVREYLGGLVEGGRLRDVFAAWAQRVPIADHLIPDKVVVPDPLRLELAATRALLRRLTSARGRPVIPPTTRLRPDEPPAARAVELANQVRYFDEGTGPCSGCARPHRPGEEPLRPGEHPVRPRIP